MLYQPLPSTTLSNSPADQTLELLQRRLGHAEDEAQKLSKQLVSYGFKRSASEMPEYGKLSNQKTEISSDVTGTGDTMVPRICKVESVLESLKSGVKSLEAEKSITSSQLLQERNQIQETYSLKIKELESDIDTYQATIKSHLEAKTLLERQNLKLKKASMKRVESQKMLLGKLKEKDGEIACFEKKFAEKMKKKIDDNHTLLHLKISEMEATVESERMNVAKLNAQCESLTNDAMLAREEFEKEYGRRLHLENILDSYTKDSELKARELGEKTEEFMKVKQRMEKMEFQCQQQKIKADKLQKALELAASEKQELREYLKVATIDNQALISQGREVLLREKVKVENVRAQHNKVLDSTKASLLQEMDNQRKLSEKLECDNIEMKRKIVGYESKQNDYKFKLKMLEQNHAIEISRLDSAVSSSQHIQDELNKQLETMKQEYLSDKNVVLHEKSIASQQMRELEKNLQQSQQYCKKVENEKIDLSEKLSWISTNQKSQQNMENRFADMVAKKNALAYEKGVLISQVEELQLQADEYIEAKTQYESLKSKCENMEIQLRKMKNKHDDMQIEIKEKINALQTVTLKHNMCKSLLQKTEKDLKVVIAERAEALKEAQKLVTHVKDITAKYEEQMSHLKSRLVESNKERGNIGTTFETLMSTNDNLQKQLLQLEENLGKKDGQLEFLKNTRTASEDMIKKLQAELVSLTGKLNMFEEKDNKEVVKLKQTIDQVVKDREYYKNIMKEKDEEYQSLREKVVKLNSELKRKDRELKAYIEAKKHNFESEKEKKEVQIEELKDMHRKEINKVKYQLQDIKVLLKKKEALHKEKLKDMSSQLQKMEVDKLLYMEKNNEQTKYLDNFMSQIVDLQGELSNIADAQNESSFKMKESETTLGSEKKKRKNIELKYKELLKKYAEIKMTKLPTSGDIVSIHHSSTNGINKLVTEEKLQTEDLIRKCQNTMKKDERKLERLSQELDHLHRGKNVT